MYQEQQAGYAVAAECLLLSKVSPNLSPSSICISDSVRKPIATFIDDAFPFL